MENSENKQSQIITKETTDLGFAAYLLMNDMKIVKLESNNYGGKYNFKFEDNNSKFDELQMNYMNSESRKFDGSMRIIKMMIKTKSNSNARN